MVWAGCGGSTEPELSDGAMGTQPLPQLPPKRPTTDPKINAYLDQVVKVYADAKTYRDRGTVVEVEVAGDRTQETRRRFQTLYQRPDRFRLEIERLGPDGEPVEREVYWTDSGPGTLIVVAGNPPERRETTMLDGLSLTDPLAKVVPRLLIKEIAPGHRRTLDRMELPELSEETVEVDGRPCRKFTGSYDGAETEAYLDAETMLVRKVVQRSSRQGSRTETTITYEPEVNGEIAAEEFGDPPTEASE
jgi:hypothetical protein